jgi:adenine deaminase
MSPIESLRAATSRAAACIGNERLGRIAPGGLADIVLIEGNPTQRIPGHPRIVAVVRAGRVLRATDLLLQARDELASNTPDPIEGEIARPLPAELGL